jgi:hypothetical protein
MYVEKMFLCMSELDGPAVSALCNRRYLEFLRVSEGTLSRWSRLLLQSVAPTNPHWARVVGYGPFSLCVIQKEGQCSISGDINRLMMMIMKFWLAKNCPELRIAGFPVLLI